LERQGIDAATAALASALCAGRLEALRQHDISQILAARQKAYTVLVDIIHGRTAAVFMQARQLVGKREACEELLYWLALLCRDLAMLNVTPQRPLYNHDLGHDLTPLARGLSLDSLLEAFACIEQTRAFLRMNLNPQLVFERLLLQLQPMLSQEGQRKTLLSR
jgi:DNA polymerase III gamma/tau subunit